MNDMKRAKPCCARIGVIRESTCPKHDGFIIPTPRFLVRPGCCGLHSHAIPLCPAISGATMQQVGIESWCRKAISQMRKPTHTSLGTAWHR
ncbi:hypothetical protein CC1G_14992 [Coprinopsis cinerea okayama7|uniref:Uncharacterized protein n=1 Tax=Coprinopsis cinerea (strain Okayama-7 / 130 / ATCC MYA-4618 / FGSC 9003) TaxID=240176 RepID=D6RP16_COPC7|nr:hypothetical protein CC1G_14992 [Coprinopsis cinerea okayama7\|eukprot:XP_002910661.1 hypothetical protein CC1G_14992 [Coprinopsis cinerea okayama7\